MIHKIVSISILLMIMASSLYFYNHKGKTYRHGKSIKISALPGFAWMTRYLQISSMIINVLAFLTHSVALLKIHNSIPLLYCGLAISIVGLVIFISAKITLGKSYSPCFDSFVPQSLVTSGVYSQIRHPIYTANILILIGLFVANGSLWNVMNIAILAIYYGTSALSEEKTLRVQLAGYSDYCRKTKRFIPKLF